METHSILEAGSVVPWGEEFQLVNFGQEPQQGLSGLTHEETLEIPKLTVAINNLSKEHFSEFLPNSTVYLEVEKFKKSLGISI